jgi:hypothetical protein
LAQRDGDQLHAELPGSAVGDLPVSLDVDHPGPIRSPPRRT